MQSNKKILILVSVVFLLMMISCVENVTNSNDGYPSIEIISPLSGDTLQIGKNEIQYEASDYAGGGGLEQFEVIFETVNGDSAQIYEATNGSETSIYITLNDSSLVGTTLDYYVNVRNSDGNYATSDVQEDLYIDEAHIAPEAPDSLALTKTSTGSVLLTWNDNSSSEDYFELWRKVGSSGTFVLYKTLDKNTIAYRDQNLSESITYYYKVRAGNDYGNSDYSNVVSTLGGSSFNLQAEALGASSILLTWESNETNIIGFKIQRTNPDNGNFVQIDIADASNREYTDASCEASTSYTYRIASFNSTSQSAWSNEATATTADSDIDGPTGLVATFNRSGRYVEIVWIDNSNEENGSYIERRQGTSGSYSQIGTTEADENVYKDYTVSSGNVYYYRVRQISSEGYFTEYSNADSAYVEELAPLAPSGLEIYDVEGSDTLFSLIWSDNSNDEEGFQVYRKSGSSGPYKLYNYFDAKESTGDYGITISIADTSIEYFFKVRAYKDNLYSDFSNEVSTKGSVSSNNISISLSSVSSDAATIQWEDIYSNELVYKIERRRVSSPADNNFIEIGSIGASTGTGKTKTYTDTKDITSNTEYIYRVRAYLDTQTYSDYSNELTVTTANE